RSTLRTLQPTLNSPRSAARYSRAIRPHRPPSRSPAFFSGHASRSMQSRSSPRSKTRSSATWRRRIVSGVADTWEPGMAEELTFKDEAAALYDEAFAHVTAYFMPFLLRAAGVAPGMRVLDIATGTGLPPKRPSPRSARPATSPPPTSRRPWLRSTPITAPLNAAVARLV